MNKTLRRLVTVCVAASLPVLALSAGASAASTGGRAESAVATVTVPCFSTTVWLRLWGSLGERCFTGNGVELVNLPGVTRGQIIGFHRVCLYGRVPSVTCLTGPRIFRLVPPMWVTQIRIGVPVPAGTDTGQLREVDLYVR
jgi:hypothetical protein